MIDPDSERPIPLWAWYPALNPDGAEEAATYEYQAKWVPAPDFTLVVYGHALRGAAPDLSGGPYPVLVHSPGFGTNPASYANLPATRRLIWHGNLAFRTSACVRVRMGGGGRQQVGQGKPQSGHPLLFAEKRDRARFRGCCAGSLFATSLPPGCSVWR